MNKVKLRVFKDKFKFSAAHFLIFDEKRAERLHGHNYRVRLELSAPENTVDEARGFLIDFGDVKVALAALVDEWDEMVILPEKHPEMKFSREAGSLHVRFRERHYVFPESEVIKLPIVNTSVEALSKLLAQKLRAACGELQDCDITIEVEESPGQGASYVLKSEG